MSMGKVDHTFKFQACSFKEKEDSEWEEGLARVAEFGTYIIDFVVNAKGEKAGTVWRLNLHDGPNCYMEVPQSRSHSKVMVNPNA